ncbi:hypothetical protein D3C86_2052770 [compost metagenome]
MDDGTQAVGVGFQLGDKGEDARCTGKVRRQGQCAARAQALQALALAAVGGDQRMTIVEQAFGTIQADSLTGASDQDG